VVIQWYYSGVTRMGRRRAGVLGRVFGGARALSVCHNDVTVVLQWYYSGVTVVLVVLQWCYSGVTVVLQG
jgi:hypothetical protein